MKDFSSNDFTKQSLAQAIEEMKSIQGKDFSIENINLAELQRRTGISRQRLRTLKANGFRSLPHGRTGKSIKGSVLDGYTAIIDNLLKQGVTNSSVCYDRITEHGYTGSVSTVKRYISTHKYLVPPKRHLVQPQGSRGYRFLTEPGEAFQMDWGFAKVVDPYGNEFTAACFAMICHHCGECYIEFFPNARQENLFIGMLHGFAFMGVPKCVLTDNMKSVVIRRDMDGNPIWQKDYESFMNTVGFHTKLHKPRHPFTKGKVERLVRFVKDNFLAGRSFYNYSDLNEAALKWCISRNARFNRKLEASPDDIHNSSCTANLSTLVENDEILRYLCPERRVSFDGFINYEGRRFGVPYSYPHKIVRVRRIDSFLYIYSDDLRQHLAVHDVTWSKRDSYCVDQFPPLDPEEHPTAPVTVRVTQLRHEEPALGFDKFNFEKEDHDNE